MMCLEDKKLLPVFISLMFEEGFLLSIFLKKLGFTYLNPHVYSDTIFFMGNFSKSFELSEKILFGLGASVASFIFFFLIGYLANYFSSYINSAKTWQIINNFIFSNDFFKC